MRSTSSPLRRPSSLSRALSLCSPFPAFAAAAAQPYGTNDAGGFRNVLPPGENGLGTIPDVFAFRATGTTPPHYADQQPLYENLVYGAPGLTDAGVGAYFKDATFGVPPAKSPRRSNRARARRSSATPPTASPTSTATPGPTRCSAPATPAPRTGSS